MDDFYEWYLILCMELDYYQIPYPPFDQARPYWVDGLRPDEAAEAIHNAHT